MSSNVVEFGNINKSQRHSGNGGGDLEARVAKLESDVEYIKHDIAEIKTDIKDTRKDITSIKTDLSELKGSHTHVVRLMYLILGSIVTGVIGLLFAAIKIVFPQ